MKDVNSVPTIFTSMPPSLTSITSVVTTAPFLSSPAPASPVTVSIKALEVAEEKEAIAQYGSSDSGATLGDILGTALKRKGEENEDGEKEEAEE